MVAGIIKMDIEIKIPEFINLAFVQNRWLWFHMLAGGILAKFLPLWAIFAITVSWEIIEYLTTDVNKIYGSFNRFFLDSMGDIFGALMIAIIVLI